MKDQYFQENSVTCDKHTKSWYKKLSNLWIESSMFSSSIFKQFSNKHINKVPTDFDAEFAIKNYTYR